jgi:hypothetical protein
MASSLQDVLELGSMSAKFAHSSRISLYLMRQLAENLRIIRDCRVRLSTERASDVWSMVVQKRLQKCRLT